MPVVNLLNRASVAACAPLDLESQCHVGKRIPSAIRVHRAHFLHQTILSLVSRAPNVPQVSRCWRLARRLKTLTANVTAASSCSGATVCVLRAPNAHEAKAFLRSAGPRETLSARCAARELLQRTQRAPSHVKTAPNAQTMRLRSARACPSLTLCAWTGSCISCPGLNLKCHAGLI